MKASQEIGNIIYQQQQAGEEKKEQGPVDQEGKGDDYIDADYEVKD